MNQLNEIEPRWALIVDLDRCTGCQACVVACQAENNVPTVGEHETIEGRWLHWIHVERYWEGEYPNIKARFMPVMCQQCAAAPCEPVCPVFATYHTPEGLNAQIYNRCIGTRYCSNNCPYKVRRFNYFNYTKDTPPSLALVNNPDVTVRSRGLIEKCTFCVQRIRRIEIDAHAQGREPVDGEIQPACVQTCAPGALIFGDLNDPNSRVSQLATSHRSFKLLGELGTNPGVIYLKGGETNV